jgi:ABC-2 type transport system permease protein
MTAERLALGVAPLWQAPLAVVLIAVLAWFAGRIYRNAVLPTGARVRLFEAFGG